MAVRKGLKDTTSTHRTSGSIFPRPPRALFQPCSRGLGRAQRGGMPAPSRAHKARGRLAFSTGPDADTSGRARALGPWCPLPLACSHLQRHQPPALPTRFQIFDFDSLSGSINGSHPWCAQSLLDASQPSACCLVPFFKSASAILQSTCCCCKTQRLSRIMCELICSSLVA